MKNYLIGYVIFSAWLAVIGLLVAGIYATNHPEMSGLTNPFLPYFVAVSLNATLSIISLLVVSIREKLLANREF
jgi:hypothetical protein